MQINQQTSGNTCCCEDVRILVTGLNGASGKSLASSLPAFRPLWSYICSSEVVRRLAGCTTKSMWICACVRTTNTPSEPVGSPGVLSFHESSFGVQLHQFSDGGTTINEHPFSTLERQILVGLDRLGHVACRRA